MLRKLALAPILLVATIATTGWLYFIRTASVPGPTVRLVLPLDELAKHSSAPLLLFAAVWIAAGSVLAAAARWARIDRMTASFALCISTFACLYVTTGISVAITRQIAARGALHLAGRLQAVYIPALLVGVTVALIATPGRAGGRAPVIVAALVSLSASLDLVYHILPGESQGLFHHLIPNAAGPLAHAAGAIAALALLVAARGLARRRRRAWQVAAAVVALATALHLLNGQAQGSAASGLVLVVLLARRHDFVLPGDRQTKYLLASRSAAATTGIALYGCAALWLNQYDADQPFTLGFAAGEIASSILGLHIAGSPHLAGSFGHWYPLSLFLLGITATAWILNGWLAPWRHRVRQDSGERASAEALVKNWGIDTLAPFALRDDKSYFFGQNDRSFLAYRVVGGVAIISGDPIGSPDTFHALIGAFVEHAHQRDWRVAILGASQRCLELYTVHGLQALYHGDEAIVDTETFSLEGRQIRKVRQSVSRLERAGYRASVVRPSEIDDSLQRRLETIAADWRASQPERGFAMALDTLFGLGDGEAIFVIGHDPEGCPQGFLHFALAPAGSALSLSSMPRSRNATPNGFNEWLICQAIQWAKEHRYTSVSLNFSPFAALLAPETELTVRQQLCRQALLTMKGHFQLDNLLAFNRKFFPRWEPRFLVYEHRRELPRVGLAALAAEAYLPFQTARR